MRDQTNDHAEEDSQKNRGRSMLSFFSRSSHSEQKSAGGAKNKAENVTGVARIEQWAREYAKGVEADPLRDLSDLSDGLNLMSANPNGIARLFACGKTKLSTLFREPMPLRNAENDLSRVWAHMRSETAERGFGPVSLASGVAQWTDAETGREHHMPVLLYPAEIEREDGARLAHATIRIVERPRINPELVAVLHARGADFNPTAILTAAELKDGAMNEDAIKRQLVELAAPLLPGFVIEASTVLGCFVNSQAVIARHASAVAQRLTNERTGIPLIDAMAGDEPSLRRLAPPVAVENDGTDADPHDELGVGDVPNEVRSAAAIAAAGGSVFLDAPSSSVSAQYALNIASRCAAAGKTVLYAPCVGAQKDEFLRLTKVAGIESAVLDATDPGYRTAIDTELVDTLAGNGKRSQAAADFNRIADELTGVRGRLAKYFSSLHEKVEPWGVSAYQTIEQLAAIAALPTHPSNRVRLSQRCARSLQGNLGEWGDKLVQAGKLGEFSIDSTDTPWFKASLFTAEQAQDAYRRVVRLLNDTLPAIRRQITVTVKTCGFPVPQKVEEWGRQVAVLQNLRKVLDIFSPQIFERDLSSLLNATLSKQERASRGIEIGYWERRRLTKEARSLLRPGVHVDDLHEALLIVSQQVEQWRSLVPHGGWPVLPENLDQAVATLESLTADTAALDSVLATTPSGPGLSGARFVTLEERLRGLYQAKDSLETLPRRSVLEHEFDKVGLAPLVEDLHARRIRPEAAPDELALAWWTTVFGFVMHSPQVNANQNDELLVSTTERFIDLDLKHIASIGPLLVKQLSKRLVEALYADSAKANELHALLAGDSSSSLSTVFDRFGSLVRVAKPILVGAPASAAVSFGTHRLADVVIVDACSHAPSAEVLSVLAFAPASVVIADKALASSEVVRESARLLQNIAVPHVPIPANRHLTAFLAKHGCVSSSWPPSSALTPHISFHWVDAKGIPTSGFGVVETSGEETDEVIDLITRKAHAYAAVGSLARRNLTVITLTQAHATQVSEALAHAASKDPAVAALMPFISISMITGVAGARAGDVILSASYGKTFHGKLLQEFGALERPDGDKLLLNALALASGDCDVVAGFTASDIDESRITSGGTRLLRDVLAWGAGLEATADKRPIGHPEQANGADGLLVDLADRLRQRGYSAAVNYGYAKGKRIPLVVGSKPGEYELAVFTDDARFMSIPSLRRRHRLIPQELAPAGWHTAHVWSVGMFVDPDKEIEHLIAHLPAASAPGSVTTTQPAAAAPATPGVMPSVPVSTAEPRPAGEQF